MQTLNRPLLHSYTELASNPKGDDRPLAAIAPLQACEQRLQNSITNRSKKSGPRQSLLHVHPRLLEYRTMR